MEQQILNKEYVIAYGRSYDSLSYEYGSDRMLDEDEEDGGKPFTGLAYELNENQVLIYYGYYVDGFEEGDRVTFYENGIIESYAFMRRGRAFGKSFEYFGNGTKRSETISEYGVVLYQKEWSENGKVIHEKKEPTKEDIETRNIYKNWYEEIMSKEREKGEGISK